MRRSNANPVFQHNGLRIFTNTRHYGESVVIGKLFAPIAIAAISIATANPAIAAPSIRAITPAVFGSVALRVAKTPFQREWGHIANAPLGAEGQSLVNAARQAGNRLAQVASVNKTVNHRPIFSFNGQGAWTHGYARQPMLPAIQLAAATPSNPTPNN